MQPNHLSGAEESSGGGESKYPPARSVRIGAPLWKTAKLRAQADKVTMSRVMLTLVAAYAFGEIDLKDLPEPPEQ